jgi:hypothetical protein
MIQNPITLLIWLVADLPSDDYRPHEYGRGVLAVLTVKAANEAIGVNPEHFTLGTVRLPLVYASVVNLKMLMGAENTREAAFHAKRVDEPTDAGVPKPS